MALILLIAGIWILAIIVFALLWCGLIRIARPHFEDGREEEKKKLPAPVLAEARRETGNKPHLARESTQEEEASSDELDSRGGQFLSSRFSYRK